MPRVPSLLMALAVLTGTGCGKHKTFPVEGLVTLDGQPLAGATVTFIPKEGNWRPAVGITDGDGIFQLTTFENGDGALPGEYKVLIRLTEGISAPPSPLVPGDEKSVVEHYRSLKAKKKKKSPLPGIYGEPARTWLRCQVPVEERVVFSLSSQP